MSLYLIQACAIDRIPPLLLNQEWLAREGGFINVSAADANAAVLRGRSVIIGAAVNVAQP
jgi:hypothetical protein